MAPCRWYVRPERLRDTVQPFNEYEKTGNGFSFANYSSDELINTLYFAIDVYYNRKEDWDNIDSSCDEHRCQLGKERCHLWAAV